MPQRLDKGAPVEELTRSGCRGCLHLFRGFCSSTATAAVSTLACKLQTDWRGRGVSIRDAPKLQVLACRCLNFRLSVLVNTLKVFVINVTINSDTQKLYFLSNKKAVPKEHRATRGKAFLFPYNTTTHATTSAEHV